MASVSHQALMMAGSSTTTDPSFANVKLLMGYEDADAAFGSPGMDDESSAAHGTATVGVSAQIDTAQFKFGTSSLLLDGSSYIGYANSADWQFGSGSFTVECFIRPANTSQVACLASLWGDAPNLGWALFQNGSSLQLNVSTTGSDNITKMSGGTLVANTQMFVCMDFDGTKYRLYLDGPMVGSSITLSTFFNSPSQFRIGGNDSVINPFFFTGHIDEFRLTKGVARYASDGGLTVPVAAFPRS